MKKTSLKEKTKSSHRHHWAEEPSSDVVELKPFGIHVAADGMKPLLLLKGLAEDVTVPVSMHSVDAAIAIAQTNPSINQGNPHRFSLELMRAIGIRPTRVILSSVKNSVQFLKVEIEGSPALNALEVRADECMSFCLRMEIPIWATREFILESKILVQSLQAQAQLAQPDIRLMQRNQGYLM